MTRETYVVLTNFLTDLVGFNIFHFAIVLSMRYPFQTMFMSKELRKEARILHTVCYFICYFLGGLFSLVFTALGIWPRLIISFIGIKIVKNDIIKQHEKHLAKLTPEEKAEMLEKYKRKKGIKK